VEIETAVLIAERLVSWATLFAWLVAVPPALLIAILTVIGIGKFSGVVPKPVERGRMTAPHS